MGESGSVDEGEDETVDRDGGDGDERDGDFDPELDLLSRYHDMLNTQMDSINEIDDKASNTARLIGVLFGLILTAASFGVTTEHIQLDDVSTAFFVMLSISLVTLLIALLLSITTYLSSTIIHGPTSAVGGYMANYRVDSQQYIDIMLRTYSTAVRENKKVILKNASRFKNTLAALMAGLIYLLVTGILLAAAVHETGSQLQWGVLIVSVLIGGITAYSIGVKDYLTIEAEHLVKNDGDGEPEAERETEGGSDGG
jgi:hypothetical protein